MLHTLCVFDMYRLGTFFLIAATKNYDNFNHIIHSINDLISQNKDLSANAVSRTKPLASMGIKLAKMSTRINVTKGEVTQMRN